MATISSYRRLQWNVRATTRAAFCGFAPCAPEPPPASDCEHHGWWNTAQTARCQNTDGTPVTVAAGTIWSPISQEDSDQLALIFAVSLLVCTLSSRRRIVWEVYAGFGPPPLGDPHVVTITPVIQNLDIRSFMQFAASVADSPDQSVTWTVSCDRVDHQDDPLYSGSIDPSGLYTGVAAAGFNVMVRATSVAYPASSGMVSFYINIPQDG